MRRESEADTSGAYYAIETEPRVPYPSRFFAPLLSARYLASALTRFHWQPNPSEFTKALEDGYWDTIVKADPKMLPEEEAVRTYIASRLLSSKVVLLLDQLELVSAADRRHLLVFLETQQKSLAELVGPERLVLLRVVVAARCASLALDPLVAGATYLYLTPGFAKRKDKERLLERLAFSISPQLSMEEAFPSLIVREAADDLWSCTALASLRARGITPTTLASLYELAPLLSSDPLQFRGAHWVVSVCLSHRPFPTPTPGSHLALLPLC